MFLEQRNVLICMFFDSVGVIQITYIDQDWILQIGAWYLGQLLSN